MKISLFKNKIFLKTWEEYSSELFLQEKLEKNFKEKFSRYYFRIGEKEIKEKKDLISKFLKDENAILLVPMKEKEKTIENLLSYAKKRMPQNSIIVINDESGEKAIKAVKNFKDVILVDKEKILRVLNWKKLLPILNLNTIPKGKGTTVLAGTLLIYLLEREKKWIFQTDADIRNHKKFKPLEYLSFGALNFPQALQIKIAKSGRNNEPNMAVRSALTVLEDLKLIAPGEIGERLSQRARELFESLAKYKWILGGTFALPNEVAFERPFATGYLDETLICAFVEDKAKKEGKFSAQVSNPNHCADSENTFKKESIIVQMTANFVLILLLMTKPIIDWKVEDIAWLNKNLMSKKRWIALIPPKGDERGVFLELVANERIFPSIKTMHENGILDLKKAKEIIDSFNLSWRRD